MEWVETTAKSVDEAKNLALDQLGVAEDDAEIVVLDEPRSGLFGRMRGEARVRARVRPTAPRPKLDRRDRKRKDGRDRPKDGTSTAVGSAGAAGVTPTDTEAVEGADAAPSTRSGAPRSRATGSGRGRRPAPAALDGSGDAATSTEGGGSDETAATSDDEGGAASRPAGARRRGRRGGRGRGGARPGAGSADDAGADDDGSLDEIGTGERADADGDTSGDTSDDRGPADSGRAGRGRSGTRSSKQTAAPAASEQGSNETMVDAAQVADEARSFVQGVVDAFGLQGTTRVVRDGDDLEVAVDGVDLGLLVGPRGATLQALQEIARVAAQRRLGDHDTRLRVDVGGYRERRKEALARFANDVAAQVVASGSAKRLEPMNSADRKVIHDVLATFDGVATRSEGEDPRRCVVIAPSSDA